MKNLFSFADNILDGSCASKSLVINGKVVFGSLTVPQEMVLDPQGANDKTKLFL
jgi:hypothetical protein